MLRFHSQYPPLPAAREWHRRTWNCWWASGTTRDMVGEDWDNLEDADDRSVKLHSQRVHPESTSPIHPQNRPSLVPSSNISFPMSRTMSAQTI